MSQAMKDDMETPSVGQDIDLTVVPSPMRTTLFPENFVLLSPSPTVMEIAFLRQELAILSQRGRVSRSNGGSVDLNVTETAVVGQIQDLGHIRMAPAKMLELAKALVLHAQEYHAASVSDFVDDLLARNAVASSAGDAT